MDVELFNEIPSVYSADKFARLKGWPDPANNLNSIAFPENRIVLSNLPEHIS